jgi:hypothetical protein
MHTLWRTSMHTQWKVAAADRTNQDVVFPEEVVIISVQRNGLAAVLRQ